MECCEMLVQRCQRGKLKGQVELEVIYFGDWWILIDKEYDMLSLVLKLNFKVEWFQDFNLKVREELLDSYCWF